MSYREILNSFYDINFGIRIPSFKLVVLSNKTNLLRRNLKIYPITSRCVHNFDLGKIRYVTVAKENLVHPEID